MQKHLLSIGSEAGSKTQIFLSPWSYDLAELLMGVQTIKNK